MLTHGFLFVTPLAAIAFESTQDPSPTQRNS
jgi:hypothetical protein